MILQTDLHSCVNDLPTSYISALEELLAIKLRDGVSKASIAPFARAVAELSSGLTTNRSEFLVDKYLRNAASRRAYMLYYQSTNLPKLWPLLRELSFDGFFVKHKRLRMLDIGSGTGTAVWALLHFLQNETTWDGALSIQLTDSLAENVALAEQFYRSLKPRMRIDAEIDFTKLAIKDAKREAKKNHGLSGEFDMITMMNVLNELPEENDAALLEQLKTMLDKFGALLIVEPASRELSRRALRFRDRALAGGLFVFSPCIRSLNCPALNKKDDWCHTEIAWERPEFIRMIDDEVGTLRLSLKYSYFILRKVDRNVTDPLQPGRDFYHTGRVVSERFDEKGRTRFLVCNQNGRREFVRNDRDDSDTNRETTQVERYNILRWDGVADREHDVKIEEKSKINIISRASGARNVDNLAQP